MRIIGLLLLLSSVTIMARTRVYYDYRPVEIPVSNKYESVLEFPDYIVRVGRSQHFKITTVVKNAKQTKSLMLSTKAKKVSEIVQVLLADKSQINIKLIATNKGIDDGISTQISLLPRITTRPNQASSNPNDMSDMSLSFSLIAAMRENSNLIGFTAKDTSIPLKLGHEELTAKVIKLYTSRRLVGYYISIENKTERDFFIDRRRIDVGRPDKALASHVSSELIPKGKKTRILIAAYPSIRYHKDIYLPVQVAK